MTTEASSWETQGHQAWRSGNPEQAAEAFARAAEAYRRQGQRVAALRMRSNQAVALLEQGRVHEALHLLSSLPEQLESLQAHREAALAWGNLGLALERAGRLQKAREAYLRALEGLRALPHGDEEKAAVYRGLARIALRTAHPVQALQYMARAIYLAPRTLTERVLQLALSQAVPFFFKEI